jgi:hypothetical protein
MKNALLPFLSALLILLVACDETKPAVDAGMLRGSLAPCAANPLACPAGETCWPTGALSALLCITAASGVQRGSRCTQGDAATCGPGMFCGGVPLDSSIPTICMAYCDRSKGTNGNCIAGEHCVDVGFGTATEAVCWPPAFPDGGT